MAKDPIRGVRRMFQFLPVLLLFAVFFAAVPVQAYSTEAVAAYNAGLNYTQAKEYANAYAAFNQATTKEPKYYEAWNGKADILNRAGKYNESFEAVDTALSINSSYLTGWINRGAILYNMGRYDDELASYDKAIEVNPNSDVAWFNRAYSLTAMGRYNESMAAFAKVQELNPNYPYLQNNINNAKALQDAAVAKEAQARTTGMLIPGAIILAIGIIIVGGYLWHREKIESAKKARNKK